jgi:hypothetical protein
MTSSKYALRPVFESFSLRWQPPPLRLGEKLLIDGMDNICATVGLSRASLTLA